MWAGPVGMHLWVAELPPTLWTAAGGAKADRSVELSHRVCVVLTTLNDPPQGTACNQGQSIGKLPGGMLSSSFAVCAMPLGMPNICAADAGAGAAQGTWALTLPFLSPGFFHRKAWRFRSRRACVDDGKCDIAIENPAVTSWCSTGTGCCLHISTDTVPFFASTTCGETHSKC